MAKNFEIAKVNNFVWVNLINPDCADKAESLVNFKVLENQLSGLIKSLPLEDFEKAHPGIDFWTVPDYNSDVDDNEGGLASDVDDIKDYLTGIVEKDVIPAVIETRRNAIAVKKAIADLPFGLDAWNALPDVDRFFIIIEAHKTVPGVCLEKSLFRDEKGVDLTGLGKVVKDAYNTGMSPSTRKALIDSLRTLFFKVCSGEHGTIFNALSYTRAEIGKADLMHFCASFGGRAKRPTKKGKDGVVVGRYDYQLKVDSWKSQASAMTTLLGVIMESRQNDFCNVIHR